MSHMPKITLSDLAPSDAKHFSLANVDFDVPYETDSAEVISNANAHPWLTVDYGKAEKSEPVFFDNTTLPKPSLANDPDAVKAELDRRRAEFAPVAIESGLDQDKVVTDGEIDVTIAAADKTADAADKTSKKGKE